ncbi:MAG: hypothetical protein WD928_01130 [Gammaproteobacteria bacterium]
MITEPDARITDAHLLEDHEVDALERLYRELRGVHEGRGASPGTASSRAFSQIRDAYGFNCPWAWRSLPALPASKRAEKFHAKRCARWAKRGRPPAANHPPTCRKCGSTDTVIGPAPPPHGVRLFCAGCGAFIQWRPVIAPVEANATDDLFERSAT